MSTSICSHRISILAPPIRMCNVFDKVIKSHVKACLGSTYFVKTENFLLKVL